MICRFQCDPTNFCFQQNFNLILPKRTLKAKDFIRFSLRSNSWKSQIQTFFLALPCLTCCWLVTCLENVGEVLPLPDPKLVVLDYWGIFAYFSPPTISLFPQFLISGANACSWWDRLLDNYSAFWHLDHRRHAIVTHWFRLRISVGAVRIHHWEGKSGSEHLMDSSVCLQLLPGSSPVLPASWPLHPATLPFHCGETHKSSSTIFCPTQPKNWSACWYTVDCVTVRSVECR